MSGRITLVIGNPWHLPQGCRAVQHFDRAGGSLGSQGCDWHLIDRADGVQPLHCEVRWREGGFCVIDRCGQTYMNDARLSLPPGRWVRMSAGDGLRVGHVASNVWARLPGRDCPELAVPKELELDPACWAQLQGEPLSFRLADLLVSSLATHGLPPMPYDRRIALARHLLPAARLEGLTTEDDLTDYVILSSLHGSELTHTPVWQAAISDARDARCSLALALQSHSAAAKGLS